MQPWDRGTVPRQPSVSHTFQADLCQGNGPLHTADWGRRFKTMWFTAKEQKLANSCTKQPSIGATLKVDHEGEGPVEAVF